ncbi:hypothetical protein KM043_016470 [Ampulex compressa]|nr:hypothetical protein KM043_016470 [Ampulex compressa]
MSNVPLLKSFWNKPTVDDILKVSESVVCDTILTGTGHKQLEELLAVMDVPYMSNKTYLIYHSEMSETFTAVAEKEMQEAGKKEKQLVIERGNVINGIPHIPVITEGSWIKRSYDSSNYYSLSGTATG